MSFQSSTHFDSTTLLIVKTEIDNTIKNVENGVSNLIEDGSLPFGIDDALTNLEQCAGVLQLIEQPNIARVIELVSLVMKKVIQDAQNTQLKHSDVEAMSEATSIIQRYLDFLCIREVRAPQFLLPVTNKLEQVLGLDMTREGTFLVPYIETMLPSVTLTAPEQLPASQYVHRLFKLSLLRILQKKSTELDFRAMHLCGNYLAVQAENTPSAQYWSFVHTALSQLQDMILTEPRLRILINLERQTASLLQSAHDFIATQHDYADIMSLCLTQDSQLAHEIRDQLSIHDDVLSDNQLEILSRQLYGPDLNTIETIVHLLIAQIEKVTLKVETGQHIQSAEVREEVYASLIEVSKVMHVINLNDAAQQLSEQASIIHANQNLSDAQNAENLMNSLLFATNSLQILERNYTPSRLKLKFNNTKITLTKVEEAQKQVWDEARTSLQKICEHILAYNTNPTDIAQLEPISDLFSEVSGAMLFMESEQGYQILQKAAQVVKHIVNHNKSLTESELNLLAQTVMSADFFFEQLQEQQPFIEKSMQIGAKSIENLEQAVA